MSSLERRYRKLLAVYPQAHRARHEDEMVGVLMAASRSDQRRPGIGDVADILRGAAVIRLRRLTKPASGDWADPLAIVAVVAPILMCVGLSVPSAGLFVRAALNGYGTLTLVLLGLSALAWPAVVLLALTGRRRTASGVAWILAVAGLYVLGGGQMLEWAELGLLAAIALTWSPGPTRGVAAIGRGRVVAFAAGAAFLVAPLASSWATLGSVRLPSWAWIPVGMATVVGLVLVCGAAFRVTTAADRRASILLALPLTAIAFSLFQAGLVVVNPQESETILSASIPWAVFLVMVAIHRRVGRDESPSLRVVSPE